MTVTEYVPAAETTLLTPVPPPLQAKVAPVTVEEAAQPKAIATFNHAIEFKNVGFAYDDVVILKNINLIKLRKWKLKTDK